MNEVRIGLLFGGQRTVIVMDDSADRMYEVLVQAKGECARQLRLAIGFWEGKKAECWQGCIDALSAAVDAIQPMLDRPTPESVEPLVEEPIDTPNRIAPLAETENLQWEIRPVVDATVETHSVLVQRDLLIACLHRIARFRKKPARREMLSVSMRDGMLTFGMLNVSTGVPAHGVWMTDVVVNAGIIFNVAKVPPKDEEIAIRVSEGKLYIGSSFTPVQLA